MSEAGADVWRMRFDRERAARREAETLLNDKSRELYLINEELRQQAAELEASMVSLAAAQEALVRQGKMAALGGLVAGIAHEINTPLGVSVTAVSLIGEQVNKLDAMVASGRLSKSGLEQLISMLRDSTSLAEVNMQRAATLVQSFKMVAVDQTSAKTRRAQLNELLADVVASLAPVLRRPNAHVTLSVPENLWVALDAGSMTQVITNLIQNACLHAFPEPGPDHAIEITVQELPAALSLVIRDNGVGMTAETAERLWEPFFTTRRNQGGTGLGMHIVHNLVVERFGGTISLQTAPGQGATFTLLLPFGTPSLQRTEAP
ncbi:MAG: HAMP domain-containing histidine kinase [Myxococcales bacterium]|nr:HAMP domain-containing histidine kinase [Myxococcales bacterium]